MQINTLANAECFVSWRSNGAIHLNLEIEPKIPQKALLDAYNQTTGSAREM